MNPVTTQDAAAALDAADPLAAMRASFALPSRDDVTLIYLCGHSLGLAPLAARARIAEELDDWERLGVLGHEQGRRPWIDYAAQLQAPLARLAGSQPDEVVAMNSLTVNLHLLLAGFYRPQAQRHAILIEAGAFPSDRHTVVSQLAWHGYDERALIELAPRPGQECVSMEDLEAVIEREAPRLALILWPGVQYRTGQAFDMARLAALARRARVPLCLDLAHAIGNLPLALHDWGVDGAAWCSYKYLNGGPGALAGMFVHRRHHGSAAPPHLTGWWGHDRGSRFRMGAEYRPEAGAAAWQLSNPPILATAPLLASLAQFDQVGMPALRAKSLQLTALLQQRIEARLGQAAAIITPIDPGERGCQLSVRLHTGTAPARQIFERLQQRGVIADWREPDTLRLAPAPLYNQFAEVFCAVEILASLL